MKQQRLIYFTSTQVVLYDWQRDRITSSRHFPTGDDGIASLVALLENHPSIPTYVLIDILEEQYILGTVPHTTWQDRRAMCTRFAAKSLRGSPLRYATVQGRESSGRRDDQLLGVGITNPDLVMPLLNALKEKQIAVKGVASLPLATQDLLRLLPHRSNQVLLVTPLASGLRLSFYDDRKLKLSRLTTLRDASDEQRVDIICDEIDKTERYLGRMRLIEGKVILSIVILCDPATYPWFVMKSLKEAYARFVVINGMDLLRGFPVVDHTLPLVTQVTAHVFLARLRGNHYADAALRRAATLYNQATQLRIAAGFVVTSAVIAAAMAIYDAGALRDESSIYAAQTLTLLHQAAEVESKLPATPISPPQLRSAVEAVDKLKQWRRTPTALMLTLGRTLKQFDDIHLVTINWKTVFPDEAVATFDPNAPQSADSDTSTPAVPVILEIATLEARLTPFNGNIKHAAARIDTLLGRLRRHAGVKEVTLVKAPVATNSTERTEGEIGGKNQDRNADFEVAITVEHPYAQPS